jgi:DNA polymerase
MNTLFLDTETFSPVPITHGTHAYAEQAEVMLVPWAWNAEPVEVWDTQDIPDWREALQRMIDEADEVVIHNSHFDRTVLRHCGVNIPVDKITDTMVIALQHSLPASLGMLCDVLGVPQDKAKDKAGKKLIQLLTKPRPKNVKLRRATRETHPDEWAAFIEYARLDVDATDCVYRRLPRWNCSDRERSLWLADQAINDRGVAVDRDLARSATRAFERTARALAARTARLTGGVVASLTQRQRLLDYLAVHHAFAPEDMTKGTVTALLKGDLDPKVRELLEIRQQASATSPAKYDVILNAASSDGRLRGVIQFCGASRTGRDCLAEGTPVLVKCYLSGEICEKPIEAVTKDDLVWDGDAWVAHAGVVFSGDKDVVEHDGLVATAKHIVYISTTESMTLGEAKQKGVPLWRGNGTQFTS